MTTPRVIEKGFKKVMVLLEFCVRDGSGILFPPSLGGKRYSGQYGKRQKNTT